MSVNVLDIVTLVAVVATVGGNGAAIKFVASLSNNLILDYCFNRALQSLVKNRLGLKDSLTAKKKVEEIYSYEGLLENSSTIDQLLA